MNPVELRVTVLDTALDPSAAMWGDATAGWVEPGIAWFSMLSAAGVPVTGSSSPSDDTGGLLVVPDPDAWSDVVDDGRRVVHTGAPPATVRGALDAVRDALGAVVAPDLRNVLLLRLDDPGAAVRAHLDGWVHDDVAPDAWDAMFEALAGFGRASIFCCPGWVDAAGRLLDSRAQNPVLWQTLDAAVDRGIVDLECHGFTHMDPDLVSWAAAPDRFTAPEWYRELWPPRRSNEPPAVEQAAILAAWQAACGPGTTLVAPGEAWGVGTVAAARGRGLELFCSWSVCRLQLPVPTWGACIGSPYLDEADASWFDDVVPVVGYWHDRDMAIHGPTWVPDQLNAWRDAGATRAWSFADLASAYRTPVDAALVDGEVVIKTSPDVPLLIERR